MKSQKLSSARGGGGGLAAAAAVFWQSYRFQLSYTHLSFYLKEARERDEAIYLYWTTVKLREPWESFK